MCAHTPGLGGLSTLRGFATRGLSLAVTPTEDTWWIWVQWGWLQLLQGWLLPFTPQENPTMPPNLSSPVTYIYWSYLNRGISFPVTLPGWPPL